MGIVGGDLCLEYILGWFGAYYCTIFIAEFSVSHILQPLVIMLQETVENSSTTAFACLASLCLVLLWRFYVFTLQPLIWPSDPKVLPYWVPCRLSQPILLPFTY